MYRGLQLQGLAAGERLDVLLHVKFCAKEFDCALTRELVQLIDREADLINRYAMQLLCNVASGQLHEALHPGLL